MRSWVCCSIETGSLVAQADFELGIVAKNALGLLILLFLPLKGWDYGQLSL